MNRKMSRYKGLILSCVSMMMIVVCVCSFSFESYAQGINDPFYLPYAEPSTSDTQGYITILFTYGDGHYWTNTFFWSTHAVISGGEPTSTVMSITMTPNSINFNVIANNTAKSCMYSLFQINEANIYGWVTLNTSSDFTYDMGSKKIVGWRASGNIGRVFTTFGSQKFDVYFGSDDKALLLGDILSVLSRTENIETSILEKVKAIYNSVDGIESQLSSVINYLKSIDDELVGIKDELEDIYAKADEILEEEKKQTSWLEKIWNSIQEFLNPDEESKEESDKLESETNDKTDKLDDLNEQNKTDKTDIDSAANSVDENIDLDSIDNYGKVLSVITENQYILQILLLVFSVALVAYVLFGKK